MRPTRNENKKISPLFQSDLEVEGVTELALPTATLTSVPAMDFFDYVAERGGYYQVNQLIKLLIDYLTELQIMMKLQIRMKNHSTWFKNAHIKIRVYDQNKEEVVLALPTTIHPEKPSRENPSFCPQPSCFDLINRTN